MKISRENYETWFTDWFDNKLTGAETEELNFFLDQNPDLREEFTDMCAFSLKPPASTFNLKDRLKRQPAEMPSRQFELLCAAAAENDPGPDHEAELNEILLADPEKAAILEIYKRLKLKAPAVEFQGKRGLMKKTIAARVISIAWIGLSAAAVISILLMTGVFRQRELPENKQVIAQESVVQSEPGSETSYTGQPSNTPEKEGSSSTAAFEPAAEPVSAQPSRQKTEEAENRLPEREAVTVPERVAFSPRPAVTESSIQYLAASSITHKSSMTDEHDDGRSNVGKFIAKHFRSKVLDEESPSDAPLKGYEIAEAGIEGLNKLLGWEMALTRSTDENGEPESVRFNSRILKFNAPVKNNTVSE